MLPIQPFYTPSSTYVFSSLVFSEPELSVDCVIFKVVYFYNRLRGLMVYVSACCIADSGFESRCTIKCIGNLN